MKLLSPRRLLLVPVIAAVVVACGEGSPTGSSDLDVVAMRAESTTVAIGHAARYVMPNGGVTADSYTGTIAGVAADFGRVDDSTLVVVMPDVAVGSVSVTVDVGDRRGTATQTITAGQVIANPVASITASFDAAAGATVKIPKPATYGASWTSDSTFVAQQIAEAKAKIAELTPAEQLEIARLLGESGLGGFSASRKNAATRDLRGSPEDIKCIEELVGWENDTKVAETSAGVAFTVGNSIVRKFILSAAALTTYLKSVIAYGGVKHLCTLEKNFDVATAPDAEGTKVDLNADRFTITSQDVADAGTAVKEFVIGRLDNAKRKLVKIYDLLKQLYNWITGGEKVTAPADLGVAEQVATDVAVDADRVALESPTVQATDGSQVSLNLFQRGTQLVLKATNTVKTKFNANVGFRVKRTSFADQVVTRSIPVEKVCYEGTAPTDVYFGSACVGSVTVTPSSVSTLGVGATTTLSAAVAGVDGSTLTNRTIRWKSSDETIATVSSGGVVTGVKVGGPVTITASAGPLVTPVNGTATVTVTAPTCSVSDMYGTHNAVKSFELVNGQVAEVPLPTAIGTSTEKDVLESASFTFNQDGTFTGTAKWYVLKGTSTDHLNWSGAVSPNGDQTTYTGTYTAACQLVNNEMQVRFTSVTATSTVQSTGATSTSPSIGFTTINKVLRTTSLRPRVGNTNARTFDLYYDR